MRKIATGVAAAASLALVASGVSPAAAATGTTPLSEVLTSDGDMFDSNWDDFDVVTEAVLAVLAAKPDSAVGLLTKGDEKLTAFVPTDRAFRILVGDLTGSKPATEEAAFGAVAGLGIDTVEQVLLYHVVPGATITAKQALKANNVKLGTGAGETVKVQVRGKKSNKFIKLSDQDKNSRNARVIATDVNKGNMQIAHAIDRVLRPMDLPPLDGQESLAALLTSDGNKFDKNGKDFDIVTEAVLAVLGAKPDSAVSVLTDGSVALTAFVPNDNAFKILARDVTGKKIGTEKKAFTEIAALGIDTVESFLLYHVVPGATITAKQALKANNAKLATAADGATIKVKVKSMHGNKVIKLVDKDGDSRNPMVIATDLNKGNLQIAHGIDRVLRPINL
jgi:uncharacterized surface protein with fasciclin (FAS1) repeats